MFLVKSKELQSVGSPGVVRNMAFLSMGPTSDVTVPSASLLKLKLLPLSDGMHVQGALVRNG